jgi:hypothetical protein
MNVSKHTRSGEKQIRSLEDWRLFAPPASPMRHWVPGRSAFELAQAWFPFHGSPVVPRELVSLFDNTELSPIEFDNGEPEKIVKFDDIRNPRHSDMVIHARSATRDLLAISIEAKAEESFGTLVSAELKKADRRPRSEIRRRIELLVRGLFGTQDVESVCDLRYQLLYGTAAAVTWAHEVGASAVVFVVHEFKTDLTSDSRHNANQRDLDRFITRLTKEKVSSLLDGCLVGPISIPGNEFFDDMPLFIGKISRNIKHTSG